MSQEMILCEAMQDAGFPSKVMHYRYADQKKDKNGITPREKMEITKGRLYNVAKKVLEGWERNHKIANSKADNAPVYVNYKKLLWKRVK